MDDNSVLAGRAGKKQGNSPRMQELQVHTKICNQSAVRSCTRHFVILRLFPKKHSPLYIPV